ncbi:MAG: DUF4112 domain-containing protein [Pseudomonadota bacterium]
MAGTERDLTAPNPAGEPAAQADPALARVDRLAWLLDNSIPLPGGYRIGVDSLVGLVPGLGDALGLGTSSYIFLQAWRAAVPGAVLLRMLLNVLIEAVIGVIPVLGDLFDMVWKSNTRNATLLRAYAAQPVATAGSSRWFLWAAVLVVLGLVVGCLWLGYLALAATLGLLAQLWS